jgi:dihydrofolate reductase
VNDTPPCAAPPSATRTAHRRPHIALIAAVAQNGVIGADNRLPWHLPQDLRHFRTLTTGHSIIMGRKTWESIGKALPDRQNIVVTRQHGFVAPGAHVCASLDDALAAVALPEPVFVIGGEALYGETLPLAHQLYLTEIHRDYPGDARFPYFARHAWRETHRETHREAHAAASPAGFDFAFTTYERIADG